MKHDGQYRSPEFDADNDFPTVLSDWVYRVVSSLRQCTSWKEKEAEATISFGRENDWGNRLDELLRDDLTTELADELSANIMLWKDAGIKLDSLRCVVSPWPLAPPL